MTSDSVSKGDTEITLLELRQRNFKCWVSEHDLTNIDHLTKDKTERRMNTKSGKTPFMGTFGSSNGNAKKKRNLYTRIV